MFPADEVGGATVSSQPADSTSCAVDGVRTENLDEEELEGEGEGEPSTAELRRRRLRKLETASASSSSAPPLDDWSPEGTWRYWTIRNCELTQLLWLCGSASRGSGSYSRPVDSGQQEMLLSCSCHTAIVSLSVSSIFYPEWTIAVAGICKSNKNRLFISTLSVRERPCLEGFVSFTVNLLKLLTSTSTCYTLY